MRRYPTMRKQPVHFALWAEWPRYLSAIYVAALGARTHWFYEWRRLGKCTKCTSLGWWRLMPPPCTLCPIWAARPRCRRDWRNRRCRESEEAPETLGIRDLPLSCDRTWTARKPTTRPATDRSARWAGRSSRLEWRPVRSLPACISQTASLCCSRTTLKEDRTE